MKKEPKIFFAIISVLLTVSALSVFNQYVLRENFYVFTNEDSIPNGSFSKIPDIKNSSVFNQEGTQLWNS